MLFFSPLLCASLATAATLKGNHDSIQKRDSSVCTDLSVSSNNGDRKVAIVMDSSGSMAYNDPYDLRVKAGRALNEFLISSSEATGNQKADLVTVIDFDDEAYLDYPLGDPGNANSSFDNVDALGGTYIALGVDMAIAQLTGGGGSTDKRSAIVVFTDGEDSNPDELVDSINNATAAGIRVSFGFLDTAASSQPSNILSAVKDSRGVYATITVAEGSQNFINYVLLNGLTYNDNPQGYDTQLLAGLAETHFISGSSTVTLKYSAQQGERVNFTITSISAGSLSATATMNGQTLNSTTASYSYSIIYVTAPSTGELDLQITAKSAPQDAMFSVITNSNVPFKNCTVGVTNSGGSGGGLSAGGKAGVGIGVTAALLGLGGLGGYFAYKHFMTGGGSGSGGVPPSGGETNPAQFAPTGGEKMMAHTDIYPVDPGSHGLPPGDPGTHGLAPNGYQAPMSGPPAPQGAAPNIPPPSQGFAPPSPGGAPPVSGPVPPSGAPMSAPPTAGVPPTGPPAYGSPPLAFVPPLVPPNALNPNNAAPKDPNAKSPGTAAPQPQHEQVQYDMKNAYPDSFQHMAPGTSQPVAAHGSQPLSPGSPAPQGVSGPGGPAVYPPAPQSQAPFGYGPGSEAHNLAPGAQAPAGPGGQPPAPGSQVPFGHGPDAHNLAPGSPPAPGSQAPAPTSQPMFGHGGESVPGNPMGSGSYPPAPSSQAAPAPGSYYAPGPESFQHQAAPGGYQGPGSMPTAPGSEYQSFSGPNTFQHPMGGADGYQHTIGGADGYQHTMTGPGAQHGTAPNPMGSDPNFNHSMPQPQYPGQQVPMAGGEGYNSTHTHTMPGQQAPTSGDMYNHNYTAPGHQDTLSPDNYHQHGSSAPQPGHTSPMSPDSYHQGQHGGPSPQHTGSSPYSSPPPGHSAPGGSSTGPHPATGGDSQHPFNSGGDPPHHPGPQAGSGGDGGGDLTHHDWTGGDEYHDPDACSCSEGPGPDSDLEDGNPSPAGQGGANATITNPGVYVPGAPSRNPERKDTTKKHRHARRRFPRLARSRTGKHHHHAWLGRDVECTDDECVFNSPAHVCEDRRECGCKCRDDECEVYKRKLRERRHRDGGLVGVLNAAS